MEAELGESADVVAGVLPRPEAVEVAGAQVLAQISQLGGRRIGDRAPWGMSDVQPGSRSS